MMTILHVIDTTGPGGAETMFIELADRMRQQGYRSVVIIRGPGWVYDELGRRGLDPIILPAKGSFNLSLLWDFVRVIHRQRVDVIQSHLLGSNVYCALAGLLTRIPVIATFHGMVDVSPNEHLSSLKYMALNLGIRRFVTVSRRLQDAISREGMLNSAKNTVIYNGIDLSLYSKNKKDTLKSSLRLNPDVVLAGALGNVRPAKAYDILIQAVKIVVRYHPNVHFVIAGHIKQSLMDKLQVLIKATGTESNVHFLGYVEDSASFLAQLDIFVLSSTSEGFSISTIEAMASGLPVVVTRCGGPEEIVTHGQDGWMVVPGDPEALANGLIYLLDDTEFANTLAKEAKASVGKRFSLDTMIAQYGQLYEEIQE